MKKKREKRDFAKIFFLYLLRRTKIEYYAFAYDGTSGSLFYKHLTNLSFILCMGII